MSTKLIRIPSNIPISVIKEAIALHESKHPEIDFAWARSRKIYTEILAKAREYVPTKDMSTYEYAYNLVRDTGADGITADQIAMTIKHDLGLKEAVKMSLEDQKEMEKMKRQWAHLSAFHAGGDDSPYSEYDGYTVSDTRAAITRRRAAINKKYGIKPRPPTQNAIDKRNAEAEDRQNLNDALEAALNDKFPDHQKIANAVGHYQEMPRMRHASHYDRSEKELARIRKFDADLAELVKSTGLPNISAVNKRHQEINVFKRKFKDEWKGSVKESTGKVFTTVEMRSELIKYAHDDWGNKFKDILSWPVGKEYPVTDAFGGYEIIQFEPNKWKVLEQGRTDGLVGVNPVSFKDFDSGARR